MSMFTLVVLSLCFSAFMLSAEAQQCNATSLCPAAAPCCSEFGWCGSGSQFCLGGCNPFQSHALDSCKPNPICKSTTYTFKDESRILTNATLDDGDATKYDWTLDGGQVSVADGELSLFLTETNDGVRLSSTRYVHYGTITATLKTGRWNGVVAGFITMSNIKDEIDWEFPGAATTEGQTNYFWQGTITSPSHGGTTGGLTDTYQNYHDFTIEWLPDSLVFKIDGQVVRTVVEAQTVVNGVSQFPNTPSRIQLSLWPAGTNASQPGTIQWAGGMINWNDPDYTAAGGHFTARVKSISVQCQDPSPPAASAQGYVYSGGTRSSPQIAFTDESTVIGSGSPNSSSSGGASSLGTAATTASRSPTSTAVGNVQLEPSQSTSSSFSSGGGASSSALPLSGWPSLSSTTSTTVDNEAATSSLSVPPLSGAPPSAPGTNSNATSDAVPTATATTLGNNAVSAAPSSFSHGGPFFGNGGMNASATTSDTATASGSGGSSASGTPTQTEAASSWSVSGSSASSGSGSPSATTLGFPDAALRRADSMYAGGSGVIMAMLVGAVLF